MAMKETRHLTEVVAQVKAALPDTFYADLPIDKRVARMADEWRRAVRATHKLEAAFDAAYNYIHGGQDRGAESQARYTAWIEARDKVVG